jgi:uncharacterized protein (TIGR02231 family)
MLATLLLAFSALPQAQEPVLAPSRLDRVTIYSGQAMVERVLEVTVAEPGAVSVRIGPLPMTADKESFQTRIQGASGVLQGLEVRQRTGQLEEGARNGLRRQIEGLQGEVRSLLAEKRSISAGQEMLNAMISSVGNDGLSGYSGMTIDTAFSFVTTQSAALDAREQAHDLTRNALLVQIADLQKQLGGNANAVRPYQEVDLNLFFQRPGTAQIRLLYLVDGAAWEPIYDLRLDPDLTKVDVGLVGRIYQQTDEDWDDVQVLLSTAQPQLGLDPPSLPRRFARVWDTDRRRGAVMSPSESAMDDLASLGYIGEKGEGDFLQGLSGGGARAKDSFRAAPSVSVQDYGLSQQFALPNRISLTAGTEPRQFRLVDVPLEVRPERYIVPSLSQQAFLRAEVTSEAGAPLLPGVARIFLGPDYLGESSFPLMRQGDSTMLNLGIDPNLSVAYEMVLDQRDNPGVLSSTVRHNYIYEAKLKLSASAKSEIEVLIEEVLPIAQDDRIKIAPYKMHAGYLDTDQDKQDRKERGIWRWRVKMRPGAEYRIRWGYVASFNEKLTPVIDR